MATASTLHENIRENLTDLLMKLCRSGATTAAGKRKKKSQKREDTRGKAKRQRVDNVEPTVPVVTSSEVMSQTMINKIKMLCKTYPEEGPVIACQIILKNHLISGRTSTERDVALNCANELFMRSEKFRSNLCESLGLFLDAMFGDNVPGPKKAELAENATRTLQGWNRRFGKFYPQLALGLGSQNIPLESSLDDGSQAESMRRNVDNNVAEEIRRGFRIYDGAPLSGTGESQASLISLAVTKLSEIRSCLLILLPFLDEDDEQPDEDGDTASAHETHREGAANPSTTEDIDDIEWEVEQPVHANETIGSEEEEEIVEEYSSHAETTSEVYIPLDFELRLSMAQPSDEGPEEESLMVVRQALLDSRLTVERTVAPEVRIWSETLERVVTRSPTRDSEWAQLLIRVKRLLLDVQTAIARCDRLDVTPRTKPPPKQKARGKSRTI
jgi:hypothetical protein